MKKEKIAKLKITKHSRKKKAANQRGAPAKRVQGTRWDAKKLLDIYAGIKRETRVILKHSIYIFKIILRKAAIIHMAARGRPLFRVP